MTNGFFWRTTQPVTDQCFRSCVKCGGQSLGGRSHPADELSQHNLRRKNRKGGGRQSFRRGEDLAWRLSDKCCFFGLESQSPLVIRKSGALAEAPEEEQSSRKLINLLNSLYSFSLRTLEHGVNEQNNAEAPCLINCLWCNLQKTICDFTSIPSHTCAPELPDPPR